MSASNSWYAVGDSITDRPTGLDSWAHYLTTEYIFIDNRAVGSSTLYENADPALGLEPIFTGANGWITRDVSCNTLIIQGGVNDVNSGFSLANMQSALTSMVSTAKANGANVAVMTISPWKGWVAWSEAEQTVTDNYNSWLATQDTVQGFRLLDIYTLLEDPANPDQLLPAYDNGDGVHPSYAGGRAIGDYVISELSDWIQEISVSNTKKLWRGAVEPAETGASGNEIKLWRGAVEPAVTASTSDALIGGVTRSVTRTLTRGVTEGWDWGA